MQASRDAGGKPWHLAAHQTLQSFLIKTLDLGTEADFYFTYKHQVPVILCCTGLIREQLGAEHALQSCCCYRDTAHRYFLCIQPLLLSP